MPNHSITQFRIFEEDSVISPQYVLSIPPIISVYLSISQGERETDRMRMRIMSECMCIQTRDSYHRKEIQEVRECQGLRGERAVSGLFFF